MYCDKTVTILPYNKNKIESLKECFLTENQEVLNAATAVYIQNGKIVSRLLRHSIKISIMLYKRTTHFKMSGSLSRTTIKKTVQY